MRRFESFPRSDVVGQGPVRPLVVVEAGEAVQERPEPGTGDGAGRAGGQPVRQVADPSRSRKIEVNEPGKNILSVV